MEREAHFAPLSAGGRIFGSALTCLLLACGGGGGGSPSAPPPPPAGSPIAGQYNVAVALGENTCGAVTVAPQPTSVSHAAGATRFTLTHGANTFTATLAANLTFVSDPLALGEPDGSTDTVVIQGSFTATTLTATVRVDVRGRPMGAADCHYLVQWTGTKV